MLTYYGVYDDIGIQGIVMLSILFIVGIIVASFSKKNKTRLLISLCAICLMAFWEIGVFIPTPKVLLVSRAFIESVKNGTETPIDVYDTLAWMAIGPLSEASIARGGAPVEVPDFTRGKWMRREPPVRSKYCLDEIVEDPETPIFP